MSMILGDDELGAPLAPLDLPPASPPVQVIGMWDMERERPWFYASLYGVAMLSGLLGHHVIGWIVRLIGGAA